MITALVSTVLVCVALAGAWTAARAFLRQVRRAYGAAGYKAVAAGFAVAILAALIA